MFESNKTIANIIDMVNSSIDTAGDILDEMYIQWVNEVEQILYSDIIKEYAVFQDYVTLPYVPTVFRFEDIHKLYVNGVECAKSTVDMMIDDTFYKTSVTVDNDTFGALGVYPEYAGEMDLKIIYFARPAVKTATTDKISLPIEWVKIITSYCRAMAYKEYNDFNKANNWIAEYNAYVQDFAAWIESKRAEFGQ